MKEEFDVIAHAKKKIIENNERCNCNFAVLDWQEDDQPDWKHHKEYCPIWKNGMIAGLTDASLDICGFVGYYLKHEKVEIKKFYPYVEQFKELLKQLQ